MGIKEELNKLYSEYNHREFIYPDPLEFLYNYEKVEDREIAGLIASSLSYGRVNQILESISFVLGKMRAGPYIFIRESSPDLFFNCFKNFKYRFTTGDELCQLLTGVKYALEEYGSLNNCFLEGFSSDEKIQDKVRRKNHKKSGFFANGTGEALEKANRKNNSIGTKQKSADKKMLERKGKLPPIEDELETIVPAVLNFAKNLNSFAGIKYSSLIPSPEGGSAFKRLNLFLRWMVRRDNVDPGGWIGIPQSKLIIPLDTHIYRISVKLGFTKRRQADIKTAIEITSALREFDKSDPVKYDFALTRLGMNNVEEVLF